MFNNEGPQGPGETQTQQDVKDVAAYGVGHRHVSHTWRKTGDVSFRIKAFSILAQVSALKSYSPILPTSNGKQFQSFFISSQLLFRSDKAAKEDGKYPIGKCPAGGHFHIKRIFKKKALKASLIKNVFTLLPSGYDKIFHHRAVTSG